MVKLQDFARLQGVTDRQVQRLLKKYAADLEGHVERRGHNGTWLSDEACEILRGKMKQPPAPVVFDEDPRVKQLEQRARELEQRLDEKDKMLTAAQMATAEAQRRAQELFEEAKRVPALEEGKQALERENEALRAQNEQMKDASIWQRLRGWK